MPGPRLDIARLLGGRPLHETQSQLLELKRDSPEELCLFVFEGYARRPSLVLKGSVEPGRALELRREHENLTRLSTGGSERFRGSLPRPVSWVDSPGAFAYTQTCLPGRRLKNRNAERPFTARDLGRNLRHVTGWLLDFYEAEGVKRGPFGPEDLETLIDAPLAAFRRAFTPSDRLARILTDSRRVLSEAAARNGSLPRVALHGDFSTANVLTEANRLFVIDWEGPLTPHLPLIDLYHFIASCRVVKPRGVGREELYRVNIERLFFDPGPHRTAARDAVFRALGALGVPEVLAPSLFVMAWVVLAGLKRDYLGRLPSAPADPNSVFPVTFFAGSSVLNLELLAERERDFLRA